MNVMMQNTAWILECSGMDGAQISCHMLKALLEVTLLWRCQGSRAKT